MQGLFLYGAKHYYRVLNSPTKLRECYFHSKQFNRIKILVSDIRFDDASFEDELMFGKSDRRQFLINNFHIFSQVRKFLIILVVVYLDFSGITQLTFIIILTSYQLCYQALVQPQKYRLIQCLRTFTDVILLAIFILLSISHLKLQSIISRQAAVKREEIEYTLRLGWATIGLITLFTLVHLGIGVSKILIGICTVKGLIKDREGKTHNIIIQSTQIEMNRKQPECNLIQVTTSYATHRIEKSRLYNELE